MAKGDSPFAEMRRYRAHVPGSSIDGKPFQLTFRATSPEYAQALATDLFEQIAGGKLPNKPIVEPAK